MARILHELRRSAKSPVVLRDGADALSWWASEDPVVWATNLERLRWSGRTMTVPCENRIIGWKETGLSAGGN